jgi:hypothetical protein
LTGWMQLAVIYNDYMVIPVFSRYFLDFLFWHSFVYHHPPPHFVMGS